jgi:hypothetical protein
VSADTEGVLAAECVTLTPTERDGERIYAYRGKFSFGGLFDGTIGPHLLASPRGCEDGRQPTKVASLTGGRERRQWQPATFVVGVAA